MKQIKFNKKFWISIWPTNIFIVLFLVVEVVFSSSEYIHAYLRPVFAVGVLALFFTAYGMLKVRGWQKVFVIIAAIGDIALLSLIYVILSIKITF